MFISSSLYDDASRRSPSYREAHLVCNISALNDPFEYTPSTITSAPCLNKSGLVPTNFTGNMDTPYLMLKKTSNLLD